MISTIIKEKQQMTRIDESKQSFPKNSVDGDTYTDDDGLQWVFISVVGDWGYDFTDKATYERYTAIDHLPKGKPDEEGGISGAENVFRWLDENS